MPWFGFSLSFPGSRQFRRCDGPKMANPWFHWPECVSPKSTACTMALTNLPTRLTKLTFPIWFLARDPRGAFS